MEVVPTGDGDEDDGVIWFRCPQCQGFLPKLGGADLATGADTGPDDAVSAPAAVAADATDGEDLPWDSPADMMAARDAGESTDDVLRAAGGASAVDDEDVDESADLDGDAGGDADAGKDEGATGEPTEPVAEYAAMLAALDPGTAVPYRPSSSYAVGQCVHHLAWDDCGVVVAKEPLPGGRRVIKCYFESAGVVRLIEEAPE